LSCSSWSARSLIACSDERLLQMDQEEFLTGERPDMYCTAALLDMPVRAAQNSLPAHRRRTTP
jgi:hypothetical protein